MRRREKEEIISRIQDKFSQCKMIIITDFTGLNVDEINQLRRKLRECSVEYQVVKNTLLTLAAKGTDLELMGNFFVGPNALAYSLDDSISPAKILTDFSKKYPALKIKAGLLNAKVIDPTQIVLLAGLPGQEILLGKLIGAFSFPLSGLVGVLSGVQRKFLQVLEAIRLEKDDK